MRILLTSLGVGALVAAVVAGQGLTSSSSLAIGYVSGQRVFAESVDGKAQVARVQGIQQQRANDLRTKQQALEGVRRQLAQATDGAERVKLLEQETQQRTELERTAGQVQVELQNLQRQMQTEVQGRVRTVLDEVAKSRGIQLVLNADQAVLWGTPGMDLTTAVIERLNAQPAAAPAAQ
jgi:Skp family chaperone for outer membrane proteins